MPSWAEGAQYFQLPRSEHQTPFQALIWANFSGIFNSRQVISVLLRALINLLSRGHEEGSIRDGLFLLEFRK